MVFGESMMGQLGRNPISLGKTTVMIDEKAERCCRWSQEEEITGRVESLEDELADRFHHSALVHRVARPRCRCVPGDWGEVVFPYPDLNWFAPSSYTFQRLLAS
uniref:Uncharacterized protein n=1 Tax=Oryza sativa subsp. japonica TaxID=39947 RepID=Q6ZGI6_ORYSJ|nr:hypothetical protein [Oryza sativa Japonica Group]BAD16946.1 hypothetical protein [Oryza sativa Japonica Group]